MMWLILLLMLILGIYLVFKGKTRGYKILGYALISLILIFIVIIALNMGVKTEDEIIKGPTINSQINAGAYFD
ncbi:hypothetical protein GLW20_25845 [Virgibacillus halodenitrificans]|nr:hypothetical protein [Virgibacillus halodenitrificans]